MAQVEHGISLTIFAFPFFLAIEFIRFMFWVSRTTPSGPFYIFRFFALAPVRAIISLTMGVLFFPFRVLLWMCGLERDGPRHAFTRYEYRQSRARTRGQRI
ncbi:hypothetical protein SERLA73DRAFT_173644 [Serpula lacrymans var. lacrymans S7.3]|uniref:Uncharacterized protein n=1 Tax=Serpula lacrymans var. lacrymans (strain S7.3) TaxID=936435 RepID=F8PF98_SERL3|nr:hypothetical protein SERLA73DRAFT_173644 [Serpula lacrymans var. lacrymans S7.3]